MTDVFNKELKSLGKNIESIGDKAKEGLGAAKDSLKSLLNR